MKERVEKIEPWMWKVGAAALSIVFTAMVGVGVSFVGSTLNRITLIREQQIADAASHVEQFRAMASDLGQVREAIRPFQTLQTEVAVLRGTVNDLRASLPGVKKRYEEN